MRMGLLGEKSVTTYLPYLVNLQLDPRFRAVNFSLALLFIIQSNFPKATAQNVVAYAGGR